MSSSNASQMEEESQSKSRTELQAYLKSQGLKATGTTTVLRQAYLEARQKSDYGLAVAALPPATAQEHGSNPKKGIPSFIPAKSFQGPKPGYAFRFVNGTGLGYHRDEAQPMDEAAILEAAKAAAKAAATPTKKRAAATTTTKEKRLKRYRNSCSAAVRQRIVRARTQRLYLVEAPQSKGDHHQEFVVMGSTGNLYTVTLANLVHCTCPDHMKGNVCKHILFVMLKVVGLNQDSNLLYQTALLNSELEEIFGVLKVRMARTGGVVMANASVQKAYKELTSPDSKKKEATTDDDEEEGVKRQPTDGDCPICFDPLASESLVYCKAMCGANFHATCMAHWKRNQQASGQVSCPNCRTAWQDENAAVKKSAASPEGYTNLGRLQGQSPQRDTSSYSEWYTSGGYRGGGRRRRW